MGPAQGPPSAERGFGSFRPGQAGLGAARPTLRRPAGDGPGPAHRPGGGVPAGPAGPRGLLGQAPRRPSSSGRARPGHRARTGGSTRADLQARTATRAGSPPAHLAQRRTPAGGSKCDAQPAVLRVGSTPASAGGQQRPATTPGVSDAHAGRIHGGLLATPANEVPILTEASQVSGWSPPAKPAGPHW